MADQESTDRLNEGERQILRLLVEGHTAKSIAATLDLSVNAVNERLREARRKTGAASSRELARTLRLQENGDKQIGVPGSDTSDAHPGPPVGAMMARRTNHWSRVAMILLTAAAIGAFALGYPASSPQENSSDFAQSGLMNFKKMEEEKEQRFRSEPVDSSWASEAEQQIRTVLRSNKFLSIEDVQFATTLCHVTGKAAPSNDEEKSVHINRGELQAFRSAGVPFSSVTINIIGKARGQTGSRQQTAPQDVSIWLGRQMQS